MVRIDTLVSPVRIVNQSRIPGAGPVRKSVQRATKKYPL